MGISPRTGSWLEFIFCHDTECGVSVIGSPEGSEIESIRQFWNRNTTLLTSGSNVTPESKVIPGSNPSHCRLVMQRLGGLICLLFAVCPSFAADAPRPPVDNIRTTPQIGFAGTYVIGRWAEVVVPFKATEAGDYELQVVAPDPDGHRVTFRSISKLNVGPQTLRACFKVGQQNPVLDVAISRSSTKDSTNEVVWSWNSAANPLPAPAPASGSGNGKAGQTAVPGGLLDPSERLIVTVGNPPGFDPSDPAARFARTVVSEVADLPVDSRAYDSVSLLVIAGRSILSAEQAQGVRDWVAGGGRLLISLPATVSVAQEVIAPFADWLPVTLASDPVTVTEFSKLEFYAGKNVRIPFVGRLSIPGVRIGHGEILAISRDEVLLARAPCGLGSVTVLALDITQPPLSNWNELVSLGKRLAETSQDVVVSTSGPSRNLQLSSTGITDLATQLHAVQEDFQGIRRASPWTVMGILGLLLLVIGPLDYVIVHRVFKKPRVTWITLPIWVALAVLVSTSLAAMWNGNEFRVNQLNLVNLDVASSTGHQRLWTNLYSPVSERRSISVGSRIASDGSTSKPTGLKIRESQHSGWSGIAESVFGGMLRPANLQVGSADYRLSDDNVVDGLPLMQWSSKPLLTEVHGSIDGLVESNLQSNGFGQLSGTITHRLPGAIEDWVLAYGNRVYRHKKTRDDNQSIPLAARTVLRVDQPNVFPRELRAFLTGKVATEMRTPGSQSADLNQHVDYDPLSREPGDILRTLTFHNEVGGVKYTGLTNRLLEQEDLSHLLRMGRAVLFGRLDASIAEVRIDGQATVPNRESTFVRIILPVKRVGADVRRPLERLIDE